VDSVRCGHTKLVTLFRRPPNALLFAVLPRAVSGRTHVVDNLLYRKDAINRFGLLTGFTLRRPVSLRERLKQISGSSTVREAVGFSRDKLIRQYTISCRYYFVWNYILYLSYCIYINLVRGRCDGGCFLPSVTLNFTYIVIICVTLLL
jgi:hypothetical protein